MGTVALSCTGVRANRMITRMIGSVLKPPPPDSPVLPPPTLGAVPEESYDVVDLVDLAILFEVL